jgi:hypothetical protein
MLKMQTASFVQPTGPNPTRAEPWLLRPSTRKTTLRQGAPATNETKVTAIGRCFSGYNQNVVTNIRTSRFLPDCWVDFLVCPRRYLAVLPARQRANLFAD